MKKRPLDEFEIGRLLDEAGWNPLDASDECILATSQPNFPYYFTSLDRIGTHRKLLQLKLVVRFPKFLYEQRQSGSVITVASTLHALRAEDQAELDRVKADRSTYQGWLKSLDAWEKGRLAPADAQLRAAQSLDEIEANLELYEPAYTCAKLTWELDWLDFEGNRRSVLRAMQLTEHEGLLAKEHKEIDGEIAVTGVSDDDVEGVLDMVLREKPDRHLYFAADSCKFRLGPEELRNALADTVGAVQPVRDHADRRSPDEEVEERREEFSTEVDDLDEVLRVRALLRQRRAVAQTKASAVAAEHFESIARNGVRTTARELGVPRVALDRAFRRLREDIRDSLSA